MSRKRTEKQPRRQTARPRTYFVHIPKTGGITFKAYLETNYGADDTLAINEVEARSLPARTLNRYRLWTGHYASDVLDKISPEPDVTLLVVRDPIARLRSWAAHGRRSQHPEYRAYLEHRTDLEALQGEAAHDAFQAYWLARALKDGGESKRVPGIDELPDLLGQIDLVGLTEHLDRFMQLVSFRLGWAPPPTGWHLNRRPDTPTVEAHEDEPAIRELLAVDLELYAQAEHTFWTAYAAMLDTLRPSPVKISRRTAAEVPIETVQQWLRAHYDARLHASRPAAVAGVDVRTDEPLPGEGWWWRQVPESGVAFQWTGPGPRSSLRLPPLEPSGEYDLTMDFVAVADSNTWDGLRLAVNGHPTFAVRERFGPSEHEAVKFRLHARLSASVIAAQKGGTDIVLTVPVTGPVPGAVVIAESMDTVRRDERQVGVALHRIQISRAAQRVRPVLQLKRAA